MRSSKCGVSTSSLVHTLLCFLSCLLLYASFQFCLFWYCYSSHSFIASIFHMFSLYSHGILGAVFTLSQLPRGSAHESWSSTCLLCTWSQWSWPHSRYQMHRIRGKANVFAAAADRHDPTLMQPLHSGFAFLLSTPWLLQCWTFVQEKREHHWNILEMAKWTSLFLKWGGTQDTFPCDAGFFIMSTDDVFSLFAR